MPGKIRPRALQESEKIYVDRLEKEKVEIISYRSNKCRLNNSDKKLLKTDSTLYKQLKKNDYIVLFDEKGVQVKTRDVTNLLKSARSKSGVFYKYERIVFSIGGSHGFSEQILKQADEIWSLSGLVMAGGIARLVLLEALYRGIKIIEGHPYHNE